MFNYVMSFLQERVNFGRWILIAILCTGILHISPGAVANEAVQPGGVPGIDTLLNKEFTALRPEQKLDRLDAHLAAFSDAMPVSDQARLAQERLEILIDLGRFDLASEYADKIYEQYGRSIRNEDFYAEFLSQILQTYVHTLNFGSAFAIIDEVNADSDSKNSIEIRYNIDLLMATIDVNTGDYQSAAKKFAALYENKEYRESKIVFDEDDQITVLNNAGFAYSRANQVDDALKYLYLAHSKIDEFAKSSALSTADANASRYFIDSNIGKALLLREDYDALAPIAEQVHQGGQELGLP